MRRPTPVSVVRIARAAPPRANPAPREVKATCPAFERARAAVDGELGPLSEIELAAFRAQVAKECAKAEARRAPAPQLPLPEAA